MIVSMIDARLCATGPVNIAAPDSAVFDGVTANAGDSVFCPLQTASTERLVYTFYGVGVPMTINASCPSMPSAGFRVWITEGMTLRYSEFVQTAVDGASLKWCERGRLMKDVYANSLSLDGGNHSIVGALGDEPWTPSLGSSGPISGVTYSTPPTGRADFFGDKVLLEGNLTLSSKGTAADTDVVLINVPYPISANEISHVCGGAYLTGGGSKTGYVIGGAYITGSNTLAFYANGVNGAPGAYLKWGDLTASSKLVFSARYKRAL